MISGENLLMVIVGIFRILFVLFFIVRAFLKGSERPPTERMERLAHKVALEQGLSIPEGTLASFTKTRLFLETHCKWGYADGGYRGRR